MANELEKMFNFPGHMKMKTIMRKHFIHIYLSNFNKSAKTKYW